MVGNWFFSTLNLGSANGERAPSAAANLSTGDLDTMKTAALTRLQNLGVDPVLLARLQDVTFEIGNLAPGVLAQAFVTQERVVLDANAAGHGWFVDATPQDDTGGVPAGQMDLLTAVLRELGHMAGRDSLDPNGHAADLMASLLGTGARQTALLAAVFAGQ